jgi:hypothetical protein
LVQGASGKAVDIKAINDSLNTHYTNAATIITTYNPLMGEEGTHGMQNLTDALYKGTLGLDGILVYRMMPVTPEEVAEQTAKVHDNASSMSRREKIDSSQKGMADAAISASDEAYIGESLGMWKLMISVAVPDEVTADGEFDKRATERNLKKLAKAVSEANASERPYKFDVVRDANHNIVVSNSVNQALGLIQGEASLVTTPFIADAIRPFPTEDVAGMEYTPANAFGLENRTRKGGRKIPFGRIYAWDNRPPGKDALPYDFPMEHLPLGVLIVGPPGTGKSEAISVILEEAASGEEGKNFIVVATQKGSDFFKIAARLIERWERENPPEFIPLDLSDIDGVRNGNVNLFNPEESIMIEQDGERIIKVPTIEEWTEMIVARSADGYQGENKDMFTGILRGAILKAYEDQGFDVRLTVNQYLEQTDLKLEKILSKFPDWHIVLYNALNATQDDNSSDDSDPATHVHEYLNRVKKEWEDIPRPEVFVIDPANKHAEVVNINIFKPGENTSIKERINHIIEIFAGGYEGDVEGRRLLMTYLRAALLGYGSEEDVDPDKQMKGAYEELGFNVNLNGSVYDGGENRYPDWYLVLQKALDAVTKIGNMGYSADITANVEKYIRTNFANFTGGFLADLMNNQEYDIEPEKLLENKTIWNLKSLSSQEKGYAAQMLLQFILEAKEESKETYQQTDLQGDIFILVLDEAWDVLEKPEGGKKSPTAVRYGTAIATSRALGLCIVAATQSESNVIEEIVKLPRSRIIGQITAEDERELLGGAQGADEAMQKQIRDLPTGAFAVSGPENEKPIKTQFRNPNGKTNNQKKFRWAGALTGERVTYESLRIAKSWVESKNPDEALKFVRGLAAVTTLLELTNRKPQHGSENELFTIPPDILYDLRSFQPHHMEPALRIIATDAVDDRDEWVLGQLPREPEFLDAERKQQNPYYRENKRKAMIDRVYRILHNKIYEADAAVAETYNDLYQRAIENPEILNGPLADMAQKIAEGRVPSDVNENSTIAEILESIKNYKPIEQRAVTPRDFVITPYQYQSTIQELEFIRDNDSAKATQPYEGIQRLVDMGIVAPEYADRFGVVDLLFHLQSLQKNEITHTFGNLGPGQFYLGKKSTTKSGGGLEWGMGGLWYAPDSPAMLSNFIDKVVADARIADSLKSELVPYVSDRLTERQRKVLVEAQFKLLVYLHQNPTTKLPYPYFKDLVKDGAQFEEGKSAQDLYDSALEQLAAFQEKEKPAWNEDASWTIDADTAFDALARLRIFGDKKSYQDILTGIGSAQKIPEIFSQLSPKERIMLHYGKLNTELDALEHKLYGPNYDRSREILSRLDEILGQNPDPEINKLWIAEKDRLVEELDSIKAEGLEERERVKIQAKRSAIRTQELTEEEVEKVMQKRREKELRLKRNWITESSKFDFGVEQAEGEGEARLISLLGQDVPDSLRYRALKSRLKMEKALLESELLLQIGEAPPDELMNNARHSMQQILTAMVDINNPRKSITFINTYLIEGNALIEGFMPQDEDSDTLYRRQKALAALEDKIKWLEERKPGGESDGQGNPPTETTEAPAVQATQAETKKTKDNIKVEVVVIPLNDKSTTGNVDKKGKIDLSEIIDPSTSWISAKQAYRMHTEHAKKTEEYASSWNERWIDLNNSSHLPSEERFRSLTDLLNERLSMMGELGGVPTLTDKLYQQPEDRLKDYLKDTTPSSARFRGLLERLAVEDAFTQAKELMFKGVQTQEDQHKAFNLFWKTYNLLNQYFLTQNDIPDNRISITMLQAFEVEGGKILDDYEMEVSNDVLPHTSNPQLLVVYRRQSAIEAMRYQMTEWARKTSRFTNREDK